MAVRGTQNTYQSGNDSGIFMGKQLYRTDGQGWQTPVLPEQLYPILFEAQDISLNAPNPPVTVSRFNRSASALKNQAGRIGTSGSLTLQFHVEDMAPWLREVLMSKDYGAEDTDTTATDGVINVRRGATRPTLIRTLETIISDPGDDTYLAYPTDLDSDATRGVPSPDDFARGERGPLEFVIRGVAAGERVNLTYVITGRDHTNSASITETFTIDRTGEDANGSHFTKNRWYDITSIATTANPGHSASWNMDAVLYVNATVNQNQITVVEHDNNNDNLRAAGSLGSVVGGGMPWGRGDSELLEFNFSGLTASEELDVIYTIVGKDSKENDVTECLHIKGSGTDANGTYYSRTRWCAVTSITPDYQTAHSATFNADARLTITATKYARRLDNDGTDMDGDANVADAWRNSQTQLNLAHGDTDAQPNDIAFPSGQSQLAIVIDAQSDFGSPENPDRLQFTLRITGTDYNGTLISEDIEIDNLRAGQTVPDPRVVYYSCNSYYEEGERASSNFDIDLDIIGDVIRTSPANTGTPDADASVSDTEYKIYAVSDRFEVTFNNEQDINEGMTIEEDIGDVPNTWIGQHIANATLQYGQLITLVATMTGRNPLHRRAIYHTLMDNIRRSKSEEWNGEDSVSLMDTRDLLEAVHLRNPSATDVCWRAPAQDVFVDWGCELRIVAPKCGKSQPETLIIPTSDLSFTINQSLQPRVRSDGTRLNQKPTRADRRMIEMQCTVDYTSIEGDPNEYPDWNQHFLADDLFEAEIRMYQRAWPGAAIQEEYVCVFKFGQLQLTVNPVPPVNTFGPILQQLAFKALPSAPQLTDEIQIIVTTPRWHQLGPTVPTVEEYRVPGLVAAGGEIVNFSIASGDSTYSLTPLFRAGFPVDELTYRISSGTLPAGLTFNAALGEFSFDASAATSGTSGLMGLIATNSVGDSSAKEIRFGITL